MSSATEAGAQALRLHVGSAARSREQTSILVRSLEVRADIGVNAEEIGKRQPLIIHAEIQIRGAEGDDLSATFDYRELVRKADALACERIALVETFAKRLARECLDHPAVVRAEITVDKPEALARGLAGARVVLEKD